MCIIVYKPAGQALPGEDVLRECFANNPDGAGLMFPDGHGSVEIHKGLMSVEALLAAVRHYARDDVPMILHFRIGTQGARSRDYTHPFPLTTDDAQLRARVSRAKVAIAHNGIIRLTSDPNAKHSDTYLFVRDYATQLIHGPRYYRNPNVARALYSLAQSKLAVMSDDGHVELLGEFETHDGCWYSNGTYRSYRGYWANESDAFEEMPDPDSEWFMMDLDLH